MGGRRFNRAWVLYCACALSGLGFASVARAGQPANSREQTFTGDQPKPSADPVEQIKNPVDWFRWGADVRLRHEYIDNLFLLDQDPPGHQWNFERYRARLWETISPVPNVELNARLAWESREWWMPESRDDWEPSEVFWDALNARITFGQEQRQKVTAAEPAYLFASATGAPGTLVVGRQDIALGDGWLVLEGTPLDGSRSTYFDAARLMLNFNSAKTKADLIFIQQESDPDAWLRPFSSTQKPQIEQDERGAIFYLTNNSIARTQLEGYFMYKHDEQVLTNGDNGDIYAVGGRVVRQCGEHWTAKAESAYEFGDRSNPALFPNDSNRLSAWGLNSKLSYDFKDHWKDRVCLGYEYLSGDKPGTRTNEQFDPLWARWPQWSELYVYTYASETRIAETTNLHRLNLGWQADPSQWLYLSANYHALFADQNAFEGRPGFGSDGYFRGHLFTAQARAKINRFTALQVMGEYLVPGNYYSDFPGVLETRRDPAAYARVELVFTF